MNSDRLTQLNQMHYAVTGIERQLLVLKDWHIDDYSGFAVTKETGAAVKKLIERDLEVKLAQLKQDFEAAA